MWFSSDAGVCRFNGTSFQYFTTANGMPDNSVFRLVEDGKGRIWMACSNGNVCYCENGKVHLIPAGKKLQEELKNGSKLIISLKVDEADTIWVGTTRTLYKIPPSKDHERLMHDNSFNSKTLYAVGKFRNGMTINSLYDTDMPTHTNISKITPERMICEVGDMYSKNKISFIIDTKDNFPVTYSLFTKKGEFLFTYNDRLFRMDKNGHYVEKVFPQSIIMLNEDVHGNVNVGLAKGGFYSYADANLDAEPVILFDKLSVSSFTIDREGGMWCTTLEKGVQYCPSDNYLRYYNVPGFCEKITGLGVAAGKLFVVNYKNDLFSIDTSLTVKQLGSFVVSNGSFNYHFYSFNGKIYSCGNKISQIDPQRGVTTTFKTKVGGSPSALGMVQLPGGDIYCASYGHFLKLGNGVLIDMLGLSTRPTCVISNANKEVLLGAMDGLYSLKDSTVSRVKDVPELENVRVTFLAERDGRLFITTKTKGLFILENGKCSVVNMSNGLPSDLCNAVLADQDGTVWVATNKGIAYFTLHDRTNITTLNISNGLPTNEISSLVRFGNSLFAGTRDGLCEIELGKPLTNGIRPLVYFSKITVNDSDRSIPTGEGFRYDQNHLHFYMDGISFKAPVSKYMYHLAGYDDSLKYSLNPSIEYTNLEPGSYRFEAWSVNSNGLQSKDPVTYSFVINQPWWNTWTFLFTEAVLAALLVYGLIQWRIRRVKQQEEEKRKVEKVISQYQMMALQAQMNPHFIFNAINSIQSFILKNETQPAYDYLSKFSKLVRLVLNNSTRNVISLSKEVETLKLYIELEQLRFTESFDLELHLDDSITDQAEVEIPTMLIQPYVENAIWHGIMPLKGKRKGLIKIHIALAERNLKISIEDNGVGRKFAENTSKLEGQGSMGMSLVMQKLEILKRTTLQNASIHIIDLYDAEGKASGTRIELDIPNIFLS